MGEELTGYCIGLLLAEYTHREGGRAGDFRFFVVGWGVLGCCGVLWGAAGWFGRLWVRLVGFKSKYIIALFFDSTKIRLNDLFCTD